MEPPKGYGFVLSIAWGLDEGRLLTYVVSNFEGQDFESGFIPVETQLAETIDKLDALLQRYKIEAVFLENPSLLNKVKEALHGRRSVRTPGWQRKFRAVCVALPHVKGALSKRAELRVIDSTPETYTTCPVCGEQLKPETEHFTPERRSPEGLFPPPVKEVYLAFYQPEEWEKLKQMVPPEKREFESYREWLRSWRALVDLILSDGRDVVIVDAKADELVQWCRERGLSLESAERAAYAVEAAKKGRTIKTYYARDYPKVSPLNEELAELEASVIEALKGIPEIYTSEWYRTPVSIRDMNYRKLKRSLIMPQLRRIADVLAPLLKDCPSDLIVDSLPFTISEKERVTLINLLNRRRGVFSLTNEGLVRLLRAGVRPLHEGQGDKVPR